MIRPRNQINMLWHHIINDMTGEIGMAVYRQRAELVDEELIDAFELIKDQVSCY